MLSIELLEMPSIELLSKSTGAVGSSDGACAFNFKFDFMFFATLMDPKQSQLKRRAEIP